MARVASVGVRYWEGHTEGAQVASTRTEQTLASQSLIGSPESSLLDHKHIEKMESAEPMLNLGNEGLS